MSANDKYKVWSDAPGLGAECPSFETLEWPELKSASEDVQKMGKVSVGNGKVTIITFCCKLNKADLYTLTVVSDFNDKYGDKVQAMCISRDKAVADCDKMYAKYDGKFAKETTGPNGEVGVDIKINFPIAFDPEDKVNKALKQTLVKGTVGVGYCIIVDGEGKIAWYGEYVRGVDVVGQIADQLDNIVNGKDLIDNGPNPVQDESEDEEDGANDIAGDMDDLDPFAGGDGY